MPELVLPDGSPLRAPAPAAAERSAARFHVVGPTQFRAADPISQELGGWQPGLTSPASEMWGERDPIVARAQDITRNNGYAAGVLQTQVDGVIGKNWRLRPTPNWQALGLDYKTAAEWSRLVAAKWRSYADDHGCWIDVGRRQRFGGLLRTEFTTWILSGDHCSAVRWMPRRVGPGRARYATCFQLIDPDRLSNPYGEPESPELRQGVRIDPSTGEPIGFWFRDAHPTDWPTSIDSWTWTYLPRETPWGRPMVVHGYEVQRDGQVRGKPPMAAIIEALRLQDVYERAEASSAILNSIYAATLETEFGADPEAAKDIFGSDPVTGAALPPNISMRLRGVQIPTMPPGVRLKFNAPTRPGAAQFKEFEAAVLRRVAAGTGLSYEQVSKDYSQTNYSSARAALLESWKFMQGRSEFMASSSADIKYACWLEEAINIGEVELPPGSPDFYNHKSDWTACSWIGPGRGWIDRTKEVQAAVMSVDAGLSTLTDEAADQGTDFEENAEKRAYEFEFLKNLGLENTASKVYLANTASITKDDQPSQNDPDGGAAPAGAE